MNWVAVSTCAVGELVVQPRQRPGRSFHGSLAVVVGPSVQGGTWVLDGNDLGCSVASADVGHLPAGAPVVTA